MSTTTTTGALASWRRAFALRRNLRLMSVQAPSTFGQVDGLRALAVIWVVLGHVYWIAGAMLPSEAFAPLVLDRRLAVAWNGDLGVDTFFVISGFLISGIIFDEFRRTGTVSLGVFYVRRGMRLLPALWVTLLVYWKLGFPNVEHVWANLLYVNNFLPLPRQCLPWGWSLAIEEQFYLLFPVFFLLAYPVSRRFWKRALLGLVSLAFSIAWMETYRAGAAFPVTLATWLNGAKRVGDWAREFDLLIDKPHMAFGSFLVGILVASLVREPGFGGFFERRRRLSWAMFGSALVTVLFIAFYPCRHPDFSLGSPALNQLFMAWRKYLFSAGVAGLLLASFTTHPIGRAGRAALCMRWYYPFAQLSYSAYLLHPLVIVLVFETYGLPRSVGPGSLFLYFLANVALIFLCSAVLYLCVERPFMNLRPHVRDQPPDEARARGLAGSKAPVRRVA